MIITLRHNLIGVFLLCIFIFTAVFVHGADTYADYLHIPSVPELALEDSSEEFGADMFTGAFTYNYAIQVPPGTNDLAPSVFLSYNSQSMKSSFGFVGAGWSLSSNYIARNVNGSRTATSNDFFTLHFQGASHKLVYDSTDGTYHTKRELYYRITKNSSGNNTYGDYWILTTGDGTQYRFGYHSGSELTSNLESYAVKWNLDRVEDTYGNSITYTYDENPFTNDEGVLYLSRITYNTDALRDVVFSYEETDRADMRESYANGNHQVISRRLQRIQTFYDNTLVKRYELSYQTLGEGVSGLSSITVFGHDNSTSLPPTSFSYADNVGGWTVNSTWDPPSYFVDEDSLDRGVRLVDVNGDGLVDLLRGWKYASNPTQFSAYINTGSGWPSSSDDDWEPPAIFAKLTDHDGVREQGVRLADVDADGFVDIISGYDEAGRSASYQAYVNTGSGWPGSSDDDWEPPLLFSDSGDDYGARLADVNGDGYVDIVYGAIGQTNRVYRNTRSGWQDDTSWNPPSFAGSGGKYRLVDVNGDGLPDIVYAGYVSGNLDSGVYMNVGNNWSTSSSTVWVPPVSFVNSNDEDTGVRMMDINGDGLVDFVKSKESPRGGSDAYVYLNNGYGWESTSAPSWEPTGYFVDEDGKSHGYRAADVNGDGFADIVYAVDLPGTRGDAYAETNDGHGNFLLTMLNNSEGGTVEITYLPSTRFDNTGSDDKPDMSTIIDVVSSITKHNGLTGVREVVQTMTYDYAGGVYHHAAEDSEFRGFSKVVETLLDGSQKTYEFYQEEATAGKQKTMTVQNSADDVLTKSSFDYAVTDHGGYFEVTLAETIEEQYDEDTGASRSHKKTFAYDDYGNVLTLLDFGDLALSGDEITYANAYTIDMGAWIINTLSEANVSDDSGLIRQTQYLYNAEGSVTRETNVHFTGDNAVQKFDYDTYGNVVNSTNPREYKTIHEYDSATHTFRIKEVNPIAHIQQWKYDAGTGNVLEETNHNFHTTKYTYDVFGRLLKVVKPYDTQADPTVQYTYYDTQEPRRIKIQQKQTASQDIAENTFYDGFKQIVQQKKSLNSTHHTVTDYLYDANGRLKAAYNPSKSTSQSFTSSIAATYFTNISYDAQDRVVKITRPDGNTVVADYLEDGAVITNENAVSITLLTDTQDNTVTITESLDGISYDTDYAYNGANDLLSINDANDVQTNFTYDSLGRRTKLEDPNIGVWTYTYDKAGNVLTQTDNRDESIVYTYDGLNRVLRETTDASQTNYSYDLNNKKNTLGSVKDDHQLIEYTYDNRLRITGETVTIDGTSFTTLYTYDSQDAVVSITTPDGTVITYTYDERGAVESISDVLTAVQYTIAGLVATRSYDNGLDTTLTYFDDTLRLKTMVTDNLQDYTYSFDGVGNMLTIDDDVDGVEDTYTYDDLNRLTNAVRNTVFNYSYTYDIVGRIISVEDSVDMSNYTYVSFPYHAPQSISGIQEVDWKLKDHTGSGNDLTNYGAVWNDGEFSFDQTQGDRLKLNSSIDINNTWTIYVEMHPIAENVANRQSILGDATNTYGYLYVRNDHFLFEPSGTDGAATKIDPDDAVFINSLVQRYVLTSDGTDITLYTNSTADTSESLSGDPSDLSILYIGRGYTGVSQSGFNGTISDIRIFDDTLSSTQIDTLLEGNDAACDDLVSWYPFETSQLFCFEESNEVHTHTFESDDEGWGGGSHSIMYGGYYEETSNYSTIYSGDLDLTSLDTYRIEMVVWSKDNQYAKFYPNSPQQSAVSPHFYYERNGADFNIKFYNGSYHSIASDAPKDQNITWVIDVDRTTACINATFIWDGDSAHMDSKCGANTVDDYLHWTGGDTGPGGYLRIMEVTIYDIS